MKQTRFETRDLVRALGHYGIYVDSMNAGDDMQDGDLIVAENVRVQIPTYGDPPRVVSDAFHGDLRCYPPRDTVAALAADIRCALSENPSALASSSVH
jgi:hypothetical protein